jgi:hypothetical protein
MFSRSFAACSILTTAVLSALPGSAATFSVTKNFWGDNTTTGTFAWAIHQANTTPGHDTIGLSTNVSIDDYTGTFHVRRLTDITDPAGLRIQGNGHSLIGNPSFVTPEGVVHTKTNPQHFRPGDQNAATTYSFAKIADNVSSVVVDNFVVDGLNSFLNIGKGTVVTIRDSIIKYMGDFGQHPAPILEAFDDSILNLQRVTISHINNFQKPLAGSEFIWFPAIAGQNANLNIERSTLDLVTSSTAGGMTWNGGTANIVSSSILGKGLSVTDYLKEGVLNVVNSVVRPYDSSATARIQAYNGGTANVIASTIQFDASFTGDVHSCPTNYTCNGAPLQAANGGTINLVSSAVSAINTEMALINNPYSDSYNTLTGTLTADANTYVQPVPNQDAAALMSLFGQPNLRTSGDPFALTPNIPPYPPIYVALPAGVEPLRNGPLINIVVDANGANKLINPIDGSVIRTDVYGNPRTVNGLRDIGAFQTKAPGPVPVLGAGAAFGMTRRLRRSIRQSSGRRQLMG